MVNKKRRAGSTTNNMCMHHGRGWYFLKGIIAIMLGIALWSEWLGLPQVVAIILVLVGIKYMLSHGCCCGSEK